MCGIELVFTRSVYFDVVFSGACIYNTVRRVNVGWVTSTVVTIIVFFVNVSSTLVLSLLIDLLLLLFPVLDHNCHAPSGRPLVLLPILFKAVALSLCLSAFFLQSNHWCPTSPWFQQYGLFHQLPFLYPKYPVFLVLCLACLFASFLMPPYIF